MLSRVNEGGTILYRMMRRSLCLILSRDLRNDNGNVTWELGEMTEMNIGQFRLLEEQNDPSVAGE